MKKLRICMGTSCYVAGSSDLKNRMEELVDEKYKDTIEIVPCGCLGLCVKNWDNPKSPYVKIDDEIIEAATVEKIIDKIRK